MTHERAGGVRLTSDHSPLKKRSGKLPPQAHENVCLGLLRLRPDPVHKFPLHAEAASRSLTPLLPCCPVWSTVAAKIQYRLGEREIQGWFEREPMTFQSFISDVSRGRLKAWNLMGSTIRTGDCP